MFDTVDEQLFALESLDTHASRFYRDIAIRMYHIIDDAETQIARLASKAGSSLTHMKEYTEAIDSLKLTELKFDHLYKAVAV